MTNEERDAKVDQLLHDAEHAEAGAGFANRIGHHGEAANMVRKSIRLRDEAKALDPEMKAPAWAEDEAWQKRQ
jgi:hypothetical protein